MKRIILITVLIAGLSAAYGFAQMGQGHMMGQGMMGSQNQQQPAEMPYGGGYYPCPQMMGQGMMGGMMGQMGGYGMMGPGGYGMQGTNPEAYQKYLDDTADLRKKLHNKKFDYFEAMRNPNMKRETIMKLEKEMLDIQWAIYEKSPK